MRNRAILWDGFLRGGARPDAGTGAGGRGLIRSTKILFLDRGRLRLRLRGRKNVKFLRHIMNIHEPKRGAKSYTISSDAGRGPTTRPWQAGVECSSLQDRQVSIAVASECAHGTERRCPVRCLWSDALYVVYGVRSAHA